jgi:hypothetical protein
VETLTMNIKRRFFAAIVAGTKRIEYREMKPFWKRRIDPMKTPFKLRFLNGMTDPVPKAVVVVTRVTKGRSPPEYRLHLGKVLSVRRWNRRAGTPRR